MARRRGPGQAVVDPAADANRQAALSSHLEKRLKAIAATGLLDDEMMARVRERLHVGSERIAYDLVHARRPLTNESKEAVLAAVAANLPVYVACGLAGVTVRTWYAALGRDPKLRERFDEARATLVDDIEARVEAWTRQQFDPETGAPLPVSMAQVRSAELVLMGRDPRYRKGGGQAVRATITAPDGSQVQAAVGMDMR